MAPIAFLSPLKCNGITSFSPLSFSPRKLPRKSYAYGHSQLTFSYKNCSISRNLYSLKLRETSVIAFDAKTSESGEGDNEALDAVLRLYSAIKNKNYQELSEILADECRCVCNFISFFQAFQGKTQVLEFFSYLIKIFGQNFQIVVKPTVHDGMQVGVQWRFEWKKIHVPLGKGFSFHICQTYQGKAVIRNIEMFMEPLLHFEPLRLVPNHILRCKTLCQARTVLSRVGEENNGSVLNLSPPIPSISDSCLGCPNSSRTQFRASTNYHSTSQGWILLQQKLQSNGRFSCLFSDNKREEVARKALESALNEKKNEFDKWNKEIKRREESGGGGDAGGGGWFGWGGRFGWFNDDDFWQEARQTIVSVLGIVLLFLIVAKGELILAVIINPLLCAVRGTRNGFSFITSKVWKNTSTGNQPDFDGFTKKEDYQQASAEENVLRKWGSDQQVCC